MKQSTLLQKKTQNPIYLSTTMKAGIVGANETAHRQPFQSNLNHKIYF